MKTKLVVLLLTLSISSMLYAGQREHRKGEGQRGDRLATELNLTEQQKIDFKAIMDNQRESMKEAKKTIHAETKIELSKILSAEQLQILEEKKQQRQDRKGKKGKKGTKGKKGNKGKNKMRKER